MGCLNQKNNQFINYKKKNKKIFIYYHFKKIRSEIFSEGVI